MNGAGLDILIPSYRASESHLLGMLNIPKPDSLDVKFIIVIDNPGARISDRLQDRLQRPDVSIIFNNENLGASVSRNIAIDKSTAEWLLFWDDDIIPEKNVLFEYATAMQSGGGEPGFVGPTLMPPPCNSFTRGILASDILTFWHLPEGYSQVTWGVTANLLIRRAAVGDKRFLPSFPKSGGGEDIDFCLRIVEEYGELFSVIDAAKTRHEWWSSGSRSYVRFMRWAYGDSVLPALFPRHRYYNFPNMIEFLFLGGIASACMFAAGMNAVAWLKSLIVGALLGELLGEWAKQAAIKKNFSLLTAAESAFVRGANDFGRFASHAHRIRITGLLERFDYFCDGRHINFEKKVGAVKCFLFVIITLGIFFYG